MKHIERDMERLRNRIVKLGGMVEVATGNAIKTLQTFDLSLVEEILADELNALHARTYRNLQEEMKRNPQIIIPAVSCLTISSNLERIGDLATNIAEEIIFMEEGEVVRHQNSARLL